MSGYGDHDWPPARDRRLPADPGPWSPAAGHPTWTGHDDDAEDYGDYPAREDSWQPRSRSHSTARRAAAGPPPGSVDGRINPDIDLDEVDPKGHARRAAARNAQRAGALRARPRSRARKALIWTSASMGAVLLAVAGVGGYLYVHFNGNLTSSALLPDGVTQAAEIPNKFGQSPLNILLLGSGGRTSAADCKLGGACDDKATDADTIMVAHLAADRSNATIMSIPRDTIVTLPACAKGQTNLLNAALDFGPACAVETVHEMTGLTIDHFVMVDMAGVVTLSNALGGVPVCVTNNVYDSYSHLKLPKGTSVIQGVQALEWVRTRHAFLNEVYREQAQHMFLSAMVRKLSANASLTHITTLYGVADAATKALTVDTGLSSVTDLLSLAQEFGKVPTKRITTLSAPTLAYTGPIAAFSQQLQLDPSAAQYMFNALKTDVPYTKPPATPAAHTPAPAASSAPAAPATSPAAVNKAAVRVAVQNGSGTSGRARTIATALTGNGFSSSLITTGNAASTDTTALYYPSTRADSAAAVAAALGIPTSAMHQSNAYNEVTVVIGKDWTSGTTHGPSTTGSSSTSGSTTPASGTPATAVASPPPTSSLANNAADDKACMYVPTPEW